MKNAQTTTSYETKPKSFRKKNAGFSTLDILIGISLAIIMAAVLVISNGGSTPRAKAARNLESLNALQSATDRFLMEYGSLPGTVFGDGSAVMSLAEKTALVQAISGQYVGSDAALKAYSPGHDTFTLKTDAATLAAHFTALLVPGTPAPLGKIVILQYQDDTRDGVVVNANKTTSTAFIAASSTLTGPDLFDTTANTAWGTPTAWAW